MGRVIAKKIRGMNQWVKFGLITTLTLLVSVFMYQGWYAPKGAEAVAARVQSTTGDTGTNTVASFNLTALGAAPTDGNTLVAVISTRGTTANRVSGITQTGVTWTKVTEGTNTFGTTTEIWYAPNVSGAGTGITINLAASLRAAAVVAEYRGMLTAGVLDVSANNFNAANSTAASTGTTATTTQANELWVGGIGLTSSGYTLGTITNSFTTVANDASTNFTATNNARVYFLERIVSATGAASTGGTVSTSSRWSGAIATFKATPPNNLTVANGTNPTSANAYQNSTDNAIDGFTLAMSSLTGTVSSLTLTNTNSATTNVTDIRVYRDNGTIGTLDGADVLVPATLSGQTATAATLTFDTPESVGTSAQNYLLVYDIAGGATVGNTMTSRVTAANGNFDAGTYNDTASATLTVATGNLTVGNGTNPANASAYVNSTGNEIDAFTLAVSASTGKVATLTLTTSAQFTAANVADINVYRDAGTIGTLDGADTMVPCTHTIGASTATITFGAPEDVTTSAATYLIVVDIASGATVGNTLTARVTAATGTGLGTITYSDASSATLTVATGNLTVATGTNPASVTAYRGNEYGVDGFTLAVSAGTGRVTALTLTNTNAATTNVSAIYLFRDTGVIGTFEPGVDTLIPATVSGQTATAVTLTLTTPELVGTAAENFLIVFDINNTATVGNTITSRVTTATGTGLGTVAYNDTTSATLTVGTNNLTIGNGTNPAAANVYRGFSYSVDSFTLVMSAANGSVSTLSLTNTNSAATNVADIQVYRDAGTIGTLDGSDTLVPSSVDIASATAATITFTTPLAVTTAAQNYIIVYTIADNAAATTVTSQISGATGNVGVPVDSDTASNTFTIAQGNSTIGAGTAITNANVPQGTTGRTIDSFPLTMSAGSGKVNSLTLTTNAQFTAANVTNIMVYNDAAVVGTFGGTDTLIPSSFTIGASTATVTFDTPENLSTTAKNYFIVIDVAPLATVGNTLTARVTGITGVGLGTVTNNNITSTTHTVTAGVCVRSTPLVSLATYGQVKAGAQKTYDISITNADNMYCSNSTFGISVGAETGATTSFNLPSTLAASTTGVLAPASSFATTLTVSSNSGGEIADVLTSAISVTDGTNHAALSWSGNVKTYVNDPMLHNSISFNPTATKWGVNGWGISGGQYGAFDCTTCHIPGSSNISRIKVTLTAPSGSFPGSAVLFQSKTTINDAVNPSFGVYSTTITNSTKICEACHSQTNYHKRNQGLPIVGHENQAKLADCIECHKHNQGFKPIGGCTVCHKYVQRGKRSPVMSQFSSGNSHHIQGVAVTDKLCYQCHWEANSDGTVNTTYHGGSLSTGAPVDLVVYQSGARPTTKDVTTSIAYTASGTRVEMTKLNNHCLSCHNAASSSAKPFGDGKTPKEYAWDGKSVDERYSQTGKVAWSQYNTNNVTPKYTQQKALSAHGYASANQRGWNLSETWPNTSGSVQVLCYDCHNSHGSTVSGVTSNYSSATGRNRGAILKDVKSGISGYTTTYKPSSGGSAATKDVYNPGAGLCFDCHNNQASGTKPWGWQDTYGASQAIMGYWDTPYFADGTFAPTQRYSYKSLKSSGNQGGHFGASSPLDNPPDDQHQIKGLCTPCHDPHGVSPTINQAYSVPLLKGTWMTSPYKEDATPQNVNEARGGTDHDSNDGVTGAQASRPARQLVGSTPRYNIDQNTFGATTNTNQGNWGATQIAKGWNLADATRISEGEAQFAGLCVNCHPKNLLAPKAGAAAPDAWKTRSRIHNTVKGWATTAGSANANNAVHSYTCSKCHTPHNYRLPRLMVTNCLDYNHRGEKGTTGIVGVQATAGTSNASGLANPVNSGHHGVVGDSGSGRGRFPAGGNRYTGNRSEAQNPGKWFFGLNGTNFNTCHDNANTVDGAYPAKQLWNEKTRW